MSITQRHPSAADFYCGATESLTSLIVALHASGPPCNEDLLETRRSLSYPLFAERSACETLVDRAQLACDEVNVTLRQIEFEFSWGSEVTARDLVGVNAVALNTCIRYGVGAGGFERPGH